MKMRIRTEWFGSVGVCDDIASGAKCGDRGGINIRIILMINIEFRWRFESLFVMYRVGHLLVSDVDC